MAPLRDDAALGGPLDAEDTGLAVDAVGQSEAMGIPPPPFTFQVSKDMQPHPERKHVLLKAHPELENLFGFEWRTKYLALLLVAVQLGIASSYAKHHESVPLWAIALVAYFVGATINHACAMIIHDCAHDLAAATVTENRWIGMLANVPLAVPSAMSFRRYHLEHHSHQGVIGTDMDLAPWFELTTIRGGTLRKVLWVSLFMFSYALRPLGWGRTKLASKWEGINIAISLGLDALFCVAFGWRSVAYLFMCTAISFSIHPCAAHFLQEHYTLLSEAEEAEEDEPQETFSYYGWLNPIILNVGHHNEHHDLAKVPWTRLPQIKATAPEFYDTLHSHKSILSIFVKFFFTSGKGPHSRVVRSKDTHNVKVKEMLQARKAQRLGLKDTKKKA
jgi:sphingolipid delta-4 desaturase